MHNHPEMIERYPEELIERGAKLHHCEVRMTLYQESHYDSYEFQGGWSDKYPPGKVVIPHEQLEHFRLKCEEPTELIADSDGIKLLSIHLRIVPANSFPEGLEIPELEGQEHKLSAVPMKVSSEKQRRLQNEAERRAYQHAFKNIRVVEDDNGVHLEPSCLFLSDGHAMLFEGDYRA